MLEVWGPHPRFHRAQLGEQTQGDVAGSAAPQTERGTRVGCARRGYGRAKAGEGEAGQPWGGPRSLAITQEVRWLSRANSFFRLAVAFAARTMDIAVVVPVIILYKQG